MDRELESGVRSQTYRLGIAGGVVGGLPASGSGSAPAAQPRHTRFSYTWDADRLVIENGAYSGPAHRSGPFEEHVEVWSLDGDKLTITITDRKSGAEPATRTLSYRRD